MFWHAWETSPTFDEINHLQTGFYYWRHHDMERGLEHPPFPRLWAALPLNFMDLEDPQEDQPYFLDRPLSVRKEQLYGTILLYKNPKVSADRILLASRSMMIILTLLMLALIWKISSELYGPNGGLLSLFLSATFPLFLGYGTLVNTDIAGAATALLFIYTLSRFLEKPSAGGLLYCGFTLGLAEASKLSNLILYPIAFFLITFYPGEDEKPIWRRAIDFVMLCAVSVLLLDSFYRFQNVMPPHLLSPEDLQAYGWGPLKQWLYRWAPLPDFYLMSLGFLNHHVSGGFPAFLMGKIHPRGAWYYFPVLFLLRTPTVMLAAFAVSWLSFKKMKMERREFVYIFSAGAYMAAVLFSNLNLGVRHILFVYPPLLILAGRTVSSINLSRAAVAGLAAFQIFEAGWVSPHYLAFYNLLCGGPSAGIRYSSDFDYGQDLKGLGEFMRRHPDSEVILSYVGTALPSYYGIDAQELSPVGTLVHSPRVNSPNPKREFLAVSASQIQGVMSGDQFGFLKAREPVAKVGGSIFVYDVTADRAAHEHLAEIYAGRGEAEKAQRERLRAKSLS